MMKSPLLKTIQTLDQRLKLCGQIFNQCNLKLMRIKLSLKNMRVIIKGNGKIVSHLNLNT